MKVMFFIHSLVVGGAETICTKYLLELKKRDMDVVLVVINRTETFLENELQRNDVKIISICPILSKNYICSSVNKIYRKLIPLKYWWNRIIDIEKPDVIHIHTLLINCFESDIFPARKMIYTFHGKVERYMSLMNNKGRNRVRRYSAEGMKFFALSNAMVIDIKTILSTDNVVLMPNAVEIDKIRSEFYRREDFLSKIDIPIDSYILGHIARFHEVKNQIRTINIFKAILKIHSNAYLIFIGDYKNKYGENIRRLVKKDNLEERVRFLGVRDDATKIMPICNSIILPSFTESFSMVMIEAQAHHIRAISSMTVPREVICNDNCFRVPLEASDDEWGDYITGDFIERHDNSLDNFDMRFVMDRMLVEYYKSANL